MARVIQSGHGDLVCPECGAKNDNLNYSLIQWNGPMSFWEGFMSIFGFGTTECKRFKCMDCGCIFEK